MDAAEFAATYDVSRETLERLHILVDHLSRWTQKINLIAPGTLEDVWARHIADSAQLWELRPERCPSWIDLGSGAGFPGLVIAALSAETGVTAVTLVESDSRKAAFLTTAARHMGLHPKVLCARIETLREPPFSVVSARALASLPKLLDLAERLADSTTIFLFPKGRTARTELTDARRGWHIESTEIASRTEADATILRLTKIERQNAPNA
ncbi:MAG: 16S rRNA (guanine(527)-N(7))-methyltransferase RsmG [Pseudomonadota bacterium]